MELEDLQAIVALDERGNGWIICRSDHIRDVDLLIEDTADDNGFNLSWNEGLNPGLYLVTLKPWCKHDTLTGDFDAGVDVIECRAFCQCGWTGLNTEGVCDA